MYHSGGYFLSLSFPLHLLQFTVDQTLCYSMVVNKKYAPYFINNYLLGNYWRAISLISATSRTQVLRQYTGIIISVFFIKRENNYINYIVIGNKKMKLISKYIHCRPYVMSTPVKMYTSVSYEWNHNFYHTNYFNLDTWCC